jgi:hypothetical protein
MAALTQDRLTDRRAGDTLFRHPVAAGVKIFAGALVVMNASGFVEPGTTATGKIGLGRAEEAVDNTAGSAGAVLVNYRRGTFRFANAAGDAVTLASVGTDCFVVDDQTVAATDGGGTRSVAGTVLDVDDAGVWVRF